MHKSHAKKYRDTQHIHVLLPLHAHVKIVQLTECHKIANEHGILEHPRTTIASMRKLFSEHECDKCLTYITVFEAVPANKERKRIQRKKAKDLKTSAEKDRSFKLPIFDEDLASIFPPAPLNKTLSHKVITAACKKFEPKLFGEAGCAVCGQLVPQSSLTKLSAMKNYLHVLEAPGVTRQERFKISDKICEYPCAIDQSCQHICNPCCASIRVSKVPKMALANGLWLGPVPAALSSL